MVRSYLPPKWSKIVPFCGMDHQKSNFSLISDTLSAGGCWGQPMLLFWKLVDKTQMYKPPEPTRHHNSIKSLVLLPLRADLLCTLQCETPCTSYIFKKYKNLNATFYELWPHCARLTIHAAARLPILWSLMQSFWQIQFIFPHKESDSPVYT